MSEKDDFIELLQHADLITLHIQKHEIGLGRDLIAQLIAGLRLLPDAPPHNTVELDSDGLVQWKPPA